MASRRIPIRTPSMILRICLRSADSAGRSEKDSGGGFAQKPPLAQKRDCQKRLAQELGSEPFRPPQRYVKGRAAEDHPTSSQQQPLPHRSEILSTFHEARRIQTRSPWFGPRAK